jgi:CRP-like cAMP-binding protein
MQSDETTDTQDRPGSAAVAAVRWETARLNSYGIAAEADFENFRRLAGPRRRYGKNHVLRLQGSPDPQIYMLMSGWLACSVILPGGSRQIVKIHMPGDLVGMPSLGCAAACETIETLSKVEVGVVKAAAIGRVFCDHPRLAAMLFLAAQEERVLLMDRLASIGRTSAANRVASLIIHLHSRARHGDPGITDAFPAPLTQQDIGDATGLTAIHINRTLKELRLSGIATWRRGIVRVGDETGLRQIAGIRPDERRDTNWISAHSS